MIKYGKGGGHTQIGVKYEGDVDLATFLKKSPNYKVVPNKHCGQGVRSKAYSIYYKDIKEPIALIFKQNTIYNFLKNEKNLDWKKFVSSRLVPDDSIYVVKNNTFYIIEVKSQVVGGSVDEKLQTCDFKKKQWTKIVSPLNWKVKYIYLLSNWFKSERYKDVLEYIKSVGCEYYFGSIDLKSLNLEP